MTKSFLALSIVLIIACSNNDLGGYTESIIKKTNSLEQKNPSAKAEPIPEEDLSSLDEESLSQKLINTYPWPKPKAEPLVGSFEGPHNPYDGEILKFTWRENNPVFAEAPNYEYGFDRDPTDQDPIVYISLEKTPSPLTITKKARFIPHLPNTTYEKYSLLHEDAGENQATVASLGIPITNNTENYLDKEGTYTLFGCWLACDGPSILQFWKNLEKKITLKTYQKITREFFYIELNGDGNGLDANTNKDIFTENSVQNHVNDVFKQAVFFATPDKIDAKEFDELDKSDEIKLNKTIEINLTKTNDKVLSSIKNKVKKFMEKNKIDLDNEPLSSKYWHYVFVINKERKIWELSAIMNDDGSINKEKYLRFNFQPENEPQDINYYRYGCNGYTKKNPEKIKIIRKETFVSGFGGPTNVTYYMQDSKGKIIKTSDCLGILYTEEGFPVYPGNNPNAAAVTLWPTDKIFKNYMPKGGIAIVPRGIGESAQYTLVHELAHSFGLTDVGKTYNYYLREKNGDADYPNNIYASAETNLMTWLAPTGKKLRYRSIPIACTRGTNYYKSSNEDNLLGSIERLIPGEGENQWDCLRYCHTSSDYATQNRIYYFHTKDDKSWCYEAKTNLFNQEENTYLKEFYDSFEKHYINYDNKEGLTNIDKETLK